LVGGVRQHQWKAVTILTVRAREGTRNVVASRETGKGKKSKQGLPFKKRPQWQESQGGEDGNKKLGRNRYEAHYVKETKFTSESVSKDGRKRPC